MCAKLSWRHVKTIRDDNTSSLNLQVWQRLSLRHLEWHKRHNTSNLGLQVRAKLSLEHLGWHERWNTFKHLRLDSFCLPRDHSTKNRIFFFQIFWKDGLSKEIVLEYDLACIIRKDDISFSRKYVLFFRHKRKDDLSPKTTGKYYIFINCSEKMVSPKNSCLNTIFFVISEKMVFLFFIKYDIFSLGRKWKTMIFIKKRTKIWYFLYICVGVTNMTLPSWQKNKDALALKKHT